MDTCPRDDDGDEATWVVAARGGDQVAFGRLYDAHAQLVYRYCARRVEELAEAEDLLSVVFLEAWRTRARMDVVDGSARAWLLGIARNVCRTSSRARRRQARAVARYAGMQACVVEADPAAGVDERLSAAATARAVWAHLVLLRQQSGRSPSCAWWRG